MKKCPSGAGRSSSGRSPCSKGLDPPAYRIDPAWRIHLQYGLFSVTTGGPQLVHQRLWYVLACLWESAYKTAFAAYREVYPMW